MRFKHWSSSPRLTFWQGRRGADSVTNEASFDPARYARKLQIVSAAVVLAWIGLVGAFLLYVRPSAAPDAVTALPALVSAIRPTAGVAFNSPGGTLVRPGPFWPPNAASLNPDHSQQASLESAPPVAAAPLEDLPAPPRREPAEIGDIAPLPPSRPAELTPPWRPAGGFDRWTAVYDISARLVILPDGTKLEAHSGLGDRLDDPQFVNEPDRGATPPHLYELRPREELFHGVQALRLAPIGDGDMYGRDGLLAHPYMLGPKGDSNGCVSFKDYDAFLHAYQNGQIKRLAVVARRD